MMMKVMRWPLRGAASKKFEVRIMVHTLEGGGIILGSKVLVDLKWKGPKRRVGRRRSMNSQRSGEREISDDGMVQWDEEFENVCTLTPSKDQNFQPWDVCFVIQKVVSCEQKATLLVFGSAIQSLAEYAPPSGDARKKIKLSVAGTMEGAAEMSLCVTFSFVELRTSLNAAESLHCIIAPSMACISGRFLLEETGVEDKDKIKRLLSSMRKENFTEGSEKFSSGDDLMTDERLSSRTKESPQESREDSELDSGEISNEDDSGKVEEISTWVPFGYEKITEANLYVEGGCTFSVQEVEYKSTSTADILALFDRESPLKFPKLMEETSSSDSDQAPVQSSMKSLLSWRKRKLSFRSPRSKGEPLLNKAYGEEGGDAIDWDRRHSGFPIEPLDVCRLSVDLGLVPSGAWDFGESFIVGSWEHKELLSRDGQLQLSANVFLASIDQRSESASGESACTALVAVVADWMHRNHNLMPSRAEFDALIRDGSAEWRKLCEQETYKDSFPDGHFDLETVIQAGVRPFSVVSEQSFVGFFQPEGLNESFDFLKGSMSFDSIWEEINRLGPAIYIVSWNDHFFVLKIDKSSCFLIDTLGERLHEGCNQAYILRFDDDTSLSHCSNKKRNTSEAVASATEAGTGTGKGGLADLVEVVYTGRNACREFIKGFLASVPLRELQNDLKKGLTGKTYLHRMLQIEFHYTEETTFPIKDRKVF